MNATIILISLLVFCFGLLKTKSPTSSWNTFSKEDPRLAQIPSTPEGRFVCAPENRKPNYYSPSKKFYYFRKGEQLPDHLVLIRVPDNTIVSFSDIRFSETKAYARIDLMNHGYNAIIDSTKWSQSINRIIHYTMRGRPALIVSKSYTGNIDLLEERCKDDFSDMIYGKAIHNEDP